LANETLSFPATGALGGPANMGTFPVSQSFSAACHPQTVLYMRILRLPLGMFLKLAQLTGYSKSRISKQQSRLLPFSKWNLKKKQSMGSHFFGKQGDF
jgi:hypothetical protein